MHLRNKYIYHLIILILLLICLLFGLKNIYFFDYQQKDCYTKIWLKYSKVNNIRWILNQDKINCIQFKKSYNFWKYFTLTVFFSFLSYLFYILYNFKSQLLTKSQNNNLDKNNNYIKGIIIRSCIFFFVINLLSFVISFENTNWFNLGFPFVFYTQLQVDENFINHGFSVNNLFYNLLIYCVITFFMWRISIEKATSKWKI